MLILRIILSFMKIGIVAFGGAYAAIPLVEREIVEVQQWMTYAEFADLLALDELTPGPILINSATFVGMKVAGIPGAVAATIGCVIPTCLIALALVLVYRKYRKISFMEGIINSLKCMAIALIFSTFLRILLGSLFGTAVILPDMNLLAAILIPLSLFVLMKYRISPIYVMLGCGAVNLIAGILAGKV